MPKKLYACTGAVKLRCQGDTKIAGWRWKRELNFTSLRSRCALSLEPTDAWHRLSASALSLANRMKTGGANSHPLKAPISLLKLIPQSWQLDTNPIQSSVKQPQVYRHMNPVC